MTTDLTTHDANRLFTDAQREKAIRENAMRFARVDRMSIPSEVGLALGEIRDKKLYRDRFQTFKEYYEGRLVMTTWAVNTYLHAAGLPLEPDDQKPEKCKIGIVYVVEAAGVFKIGMSECGMRRLGDLQTSCPVEIKTVLVIKSEIPRKLERHLHARFASKRIRGEWFSLSETDISDLKSEFAEHIQ